MKQSIAQKIGSRADVIFKYLCPNNWIVRSQQEIDYGIDYEIEIFSEKGQSTGALAKIQLKGSENLTYINNDNVIRYDFNLDNAQYLIDEITLPTYLVICDNNREKCYWVSLKNNKILEQDYRTALKNNQKTFTIYVSTNNDISTTNKIFIEDITLSNKLIATKKLASINFADYENLNINPDDFEKSMLNQLENICLHKLQKLWKDCKYHEVIKLAEEYKKSDKSILFKFNILGYKKDAIKKELFSKNNISEIDRMTFRANINANIAQEYIDLTKDLPEDNLLKIIAEIWFNISVLNELSSKFQWLNISIQQHQLAKNDYTEFWLLTASVQIKELYLYIAETMLKIVNGINSVLHSNQYLIILEILPEFIISLTGFLFFLLKDNKDGFEHLENDIDSLVKFTLKLCKENNLWNKYMAIMSTLMQYKLFYLSIDRLTYGKKLRNDIYPLVFAIKDINLQKDLLDTIKSFTLGVIKSREFTEVSIEDEIELLKQQMRGLGVNIDNPKTDNDKAIVEALCAINPERVLKPCIYRYIYVITSPLGKMINLFTLGVKGMYCTKHKYRMETVFLDNLSTWMNEQYCLKCNDKCLHPDNWKWTREWQQEQNKKFQNEVYFQCDTH